MSIGILITNTGTPDAPNVQSVRRYLREFLSDKRVIQLPRVVWFPILYSWVLGFRPRFSSHLYQQIWQTDGSPMRIQMEKISHALQKKLNEQFGKNIHIEMGMNYGNPSINHALSTLKKKKVEKIIVLPLFPQYSHTTTAATFDRVNALHQHHHDQSDLFFIPNYATHAEYIRSLAERTTQHWQQLGRKQHLLISFHGMPKRYVKKGDPYWDECQQTALLLSEKLALDKKDWTLCFQSKFGFNAWLQPAIQDVLEKLPRRGIKEIDIICPGFSVDCLETLEEICLRGKKFFFEAGGKKLNYIPALNGTNLQINLLISLLKNHLN